ncbi:zinc finger protein 628-like isoform X2 [Paramacrobiotus metropolitanus]|uniref:zinc finger protein 628-like isoform X2 n=1 Tax=Paramacrobiotus metropolitanus TaxID=2943436 RepID=UPI002445F360|nr:zinc finger protein 628-like isoform X2 [Paramacrobiotus metropolitanus]
MSISALTILFLVICLENDTCHCCLSGQQIMNATTPVSVKIKVTQESQVTKKEARVNCGICGKSYASKKSLKIHLRQHTGEKPYACHLCPKRFSQTNILRTHLDFHAGRRDWACNICQKRFTQLAHLRTHQRIHSEAPRDHNCSRCGKGFSSKGSRERHERRHTEAKPFKCQKCPKLFTRSATLQQHLNAHRGFRPFACPFAKCQRQFTTKSSVRRHCRETQHAAEAESDRDSTVSSVPDSGFSSSISSLTSSVSSAPESPVVIKLEELDEMQEMDMYRKVIGNLTEAQLERLEEYLQIAMDDRETDADDNVAYTVKNEPTSENAESLIEKAKLLTGRGEFSAAAIVARSPFADTSYLCSGDEQRYFFLKDTFGINHWNYCHGPSLGEFAYSGNFAMIDGYTTTVAKLMHLMDHRRTSNFLEAFDGY